MKIAVCDDDKKIREQISSLIKRQAPDSDSCQYTSGDGCIAFAGLRKSGSKRLEIKGFRHFGIKADEGKMGH